MVYYLRSSHLGHKLWVPRVSRFGVEFSDSNSVNNVWGEQASYKEPFKQAICSMDQAVTSAFNGHIL